MHWGVAYQLLEIQTTQSPEVGKNISKSNNHVAKHVEGNMFE
jgi:hypothetical protein